MKYVQEQPSAGPETTGDAVEPEDRAWTGRGDAVPFVGRRGFVAGGVGGLALAILAPRLDEAHALTPVHGSSVRLIRLASGTSTIVRTFKDIVGSTTPMSYVRFKQTDGTRRIAIGCIGLSNQLQVFDPETGALKAVASAVTGAQGGVQQAVYVPKASGILSVTSSGIHLTDSTMKPVLIGKLGAGSTIGYEPTLDKSGAVWVGTYGQGGKGTFARIDAVALTVTMMKPVAADTDYVRCIAVAGDIVWGGTGAIRPRLVSMSIATPGVYKTYTLPDAPTAGLVDWVKAWPDFVVVMYRHSDGVTRTSVLNVRTGRFTILPQAAQGGSVVRHGSRIYYFTMTSVNSYDLVAGTWRTEYTGWGYHPRDIALEIVGAQVKVWTAAYDKSTASYRSVLINLTTRTVERDVRLGLRAAALQVQSLYSSRDGHLYVGGFQGDSLARAHSVTGSVRRSAKSDPIKQLESAVDLNEATVYLGSYGSADIIRYDRATGISKSVANLGKLYNQSRPLGLAVAAGMVVAGCVPGNGLQGGGLAVINPQTESLARYLNPVGPQSITGLYGAGSVVYGTTTVRSGYGAANAPGSAQIFAYDVANNKVLWRRTLVGEGEINSPILLGSYVYVSLANGVARVVAADGKPWGTYLLYSGRHAAGYRTTQLEYHSGTKSIIHAGGGAVRAIQLATGKTWLLAGGGYSLPSIGPDGRLFALRGSRDIVELSVSVPTQ